MRPPVSERVKLLIAVLVLQLCYAGLHMASRAALNMGIGELVLPLYRNIIGMVLLAPFAYFLEKKDRPPLTLPLLCQIFLLALLGITASQGFYYLGLFYLSPTYTSAIQNTLPAMTFAMAAALRLEQVHINTRYGVAKVVGTATSIGGATIVTLYKGPPLLHHHHHHHQHSSKQLFLVAPSSTILNWTLGCVYILANCLAWSGWMVFQVPVLRKYPAKLSLNAIVYFFGLIQLLVVAAFAEKDTDKWQIHSGGELLAVLYAGVVGSLIAYSLQIWSIDRGGPLFVAIFQPVQTVVVAFMAAALLGDQFYLGGVIGSVCIALGLYLVLWGRSVEKKKAAEETMQEDLTRRLLFQES